MPLNLSRLLSRSVAVISIGVCIGTGALDAAPVQAGPSTSPPIVFVHGNGDDAAKWIGVIWLFESNGYPSSQLYSIRFTHPAARADDTRDEPNRSSSADAVAELSTFISRVITATHSSKVALIGSSRGGLTIRNYLLHGGSANVAYAILCGTPNHGVLSTDTNLNGEFNGRGKFLQSLNHDNPEVVPGVRMLTLRSDKLDKYAQPTGVAFGTPQTSTGVAFDGPALRGATNLVLPNLDHRELAFSPTAFFEMFRFITGSTPQKTEVIPESNPSISGVITGFENGSYTNLPIAGVHLRIYPVDRTKRTEANVPAYEITTGADGQWGPFKPSTIEEYAFDLEYEGRQVRYYKAPLLRSTTLLNLRLAPVPREVNASTDLSPKLLIARPDGYLSRDRDPVTIAGKLAAEEPAGLPVRDSFLADVTVPLATVKLRNETIAARPSKDLVKDLPIVDFLW